MNAMEAYEAMENGRIVRELDDGTMFRILNDMVEVLVGEHWTPAHGVVGTDIAYFMRSDFEIFG